jgi:hypothetical protein
LGVAETDTTTFPVATFTRYANAWYRRFAYYIWRSSNVWQFDDSNFTTLPEATATLVAGQEDYSIPSTAIDILEVYVMNSSGDYYRLNKINPFMITGARDEYAETDGMPADYYLQGNSIVLKPAPATGYVTMAAGLKLILDRDIDAFTITDTIQEPGFLPAFHRLLSLGAAFDFARSKELVTKINLIKPDLDLMVREMEEYYARRSRADKKRIKPNLVSSI